MLVGASVLAFLAVAAVTAIRGTQGTREAADEQHRVDFFCTTNPRRDIGIVFSLVADSGADAEAASGIVALNAGSLDDPPAPIRSEVLAIRDRLLATNGAVATRDEPEVARAIEVVNAWIEATCPVVATSVP